MTIYLLAFRGFFLSHFTVYLSLFLVMILCLFSQLLAASEQAFSIPRTVVIDVTDPVSKRVYPLFIKLPKTYSKNLDKKYPVIYLTDALYAFQIISGATRYPMNVKKMDQAIIVGISYAKKSKRDHSRVFDYTPIKALSWRKETGGALDHMAFIENVVFKYMADNYRVDKSNRTFVGNSLGGLFGAYMLMTKPQLFKNYILGSPSFWFNDQFIFRLEQQFKKNMPSINANVFIAIGDRENKKQESHYDMVQDAKTFYHNMAAWQQPNLHTKLVIIAGAKHQTAFPTTAIQGLYWALGHCKVASDCAPR